MDANLSLIASTYTIVEQIGSGGGSIVYLAEHTRLNKKIVLKADKRTIATKPDVLRREVDTLKNLSHTYIPQVYDFIVEDGTVYTVMEYIDGDSLDKPLKRGERFSQVKVIKWACQLLEALVYLHGIPPHGILHADIKPANIMLTTQGDIRLIDFNIALALGENGAVAIGRSYGYAAPEYYGLSFASNNVMASIKRNVDPAISEGTVMDAGTGLSKNTALDVKHSIDSQFQSNSRGSSDKRNIMLDVRSDIYGVGATLYHLLTGMRPTLNAIDVVPLSTKEFNPAIVAIITKAMNPNRDLRYQSAKEMLDAFMLLRESFTDFRMRTNRLFTLPSFLRRNKSKQSDVIPRRNTIADMERTEPTGPELPMRIFLSYAWKDEVLADSIDERFAKAGITLARDKRDIRYRNSIKEFMKQIRSNDYVILVLSPDYIKSANCMYEIAELTKAENYKSRILPVIKKGTGIFDPIGRNSYIVYWQDAFNKLNDASTKLEPLNRSASIEDLKRYERIMRDLPFFLDDISDMSMIECEDFINDNDFARILEIVYEL